MVQAQNLLFTGMSRLRKFTCRGIAEKIMRESLAARLACRHWSRYVGIFQRNEAGVPFMASSAQPFSKFCQGCVKVTELKRRGLPWPGGSYFLSHKLPSGMNINNVDAEARFSIPIDTVGDI
jgi:hypothetical protein